MGSASHVRGVLLVVVLALLVAACGGERQRSAGKPVKGGMLVYGIEQEPNVLNPATQESFSAKKVTLTTLYPLWRVTPDFHYEPLLLDGEPEVSPPGQLPFTVTYRLRKEATWSDGVPITAEDVQFTLDTCLNPAFEITSRLGCVDVERTNIIDDKTIEFIFTRPFAPWRNLFAFSSGVILPKHALEGEDFDKVWNDAIINPKNGQPIASGPFIFKEWKKGEQLTIVRNQNFWGPTPHLDQIVFRPLPDVNTLIQQFRGGEIDAMDLQPQLGIVEQIKGQRGLNLQVNIGPQWEHIDFNLARGALSKPFVRQAIAMGIDREQITRDLLGPISPEIEPLNNVIWMTDQRAYTDNWSDVIGFDPESAITLLQDNGCTRGSDGIFSCDGQRLEFDFVTTGGNELRELTFEVVQQQLRQIGVQVNADFGEGATVFNRLVVKDYDIFLFAWVGAPDPFTGDTIWQCVQTTGPDSQNYTGFCDPKVDQVLQQQVYTLDPGERAALYNEADNLIAKSVPIVPLYQKPVYLAWSGDFTGFKNNTTQWGSTWNVEQWARIGR